jgi:hypothetical protein
MGVNDLIEEFNDVMKKVVELTEEAKAQVQQMPGVSIGDGSAKVKTIEEICSNGKSELDKAMDIAEDILKLL